MTSSEYWIAVAPLFEEMRTLTSEYIRSLRRDMRDQTTVNLELLNLMVLFDENVRSVVGPIIRYSEDELPKKHTIRLVKGGDKDAGV